MSMDIRSYFGVNKAAAKPQKKVEVPKRRAIALPSDDDDDNEEVKSTPKEKPTRERQKVSKKRRIIESSDEDECVVETPVKKPKPNLSKLVENLAPKYSKPTEEEINAKFGHVPKRVEKKKAAPSKKSSENNDSNVVVLLDDDDDDFNQSIMDLDESKLIAEQRKSPRIRTPKKQFPEIDEIRNSAKKQQKSSEKNELNSDRARSKSKTPNKRNGESSHQNSLDKKIEKAKKSIAEIVNEDEQLKVPNEKRKVTTSDREKHVDSSGTDLKIKSSVKIESAKKSLADISFDDAPSKTPKSKSKKNADLNSSVISDEERHERKRAAAILYQKYKNRSGAINPGCKEIPKGKANCLAGLTFLVTGILESMERAEANQVIKDLGGKLSTVVGKRLDYMVIGEEAGPKKIATADELGVKMISEDELFRLIREKSGEAIPKQNAGGPKKSSPKQEIEGTANKIKKEKTSPEIKSEGSSMDIKKERMSGDKRKADGDFKLEKIKTENKESPEKKIKVEKSSEIPKSEVIKKSVDAAEYIQQNSDILPWVEKYKPTNMKQIIGQQGPASNCVKLQNWLSKWYVNHDGKKKLQKPNPWAKNDDGSFYKAALLSGPPGVGKTTTAHLVCKELGFDIVEFNASDTRSKKLLKEEVSELLSNKSLYGYFNGKSETVSKKHVLIMDEVDGMAGNEDRGGVAELISLIKDASVPIICMCNDRNHQKMRSLVNYCYDLRFNKPRLEQIKGSIMTICFKEKFKLPPSKVEEIITATNNDIRQTLNHLSLLAAGNESKIEVNEKEKTAKKDLKLGPWDVVRKVFTIEDQKNMTIHDKSDLFFNDYSLGPLFVQQNYLQVSPVGPRDQVPGKVALAADSLSLGDLIDRRIRSNSAWTLLPTQAMFSSVMPGEYMSGHFVGQINFPGWLGKFSKSNKRKRLAQEIHDHTRIRTSGSRLSVRLDYAPFLLNAIVRPLKEKGADGVEESLEVMKEYRLLREDIDSLIELSTWPGRKNIWDSVDGKVKAALTRAYNKEVLAYSYSAMAGVKKKKAEKVDDFDALEGEENDGAVTTVVSDDEDDDRLENDGLIKEKKKPAPKASKETKAAPKKAAAKGRAKK